MSRYINIDKVLSELCLGHKDIIYIDKNETAERIRKIPSIDIVRCKECKYNPKDIGWVSCPMTGANTRKPDDFCSYGEREGE